jgi:two-component system, sensor histidine kinase RegB
MDVDGSDPIHLRWLVRLRWGALGAHAAMLGLLAWMLDDRRALVGGSALLFFNALTNVALAGALARARPLPRSALIATLLLDVSSLTVLLALTGGPMNPFTALYVVHVALAAVVCSPFGAWAIAGASVLGYGLLFVATDVFAHHDHARMVLHLRGMWVAFAVATMFITLFVSRTRRALAEREIVERQLRTTREQQARLAALATLAGGAAHELATPLGSIAIAASELSMRLGASADAAVREDAALIVSEVRRCKKILDHLAAQGGEAMGDALVETPLSDVVAQALDDLQGASSVVIEPIEPVRVALPRVAVSSALRGLLRNARQAGTAVRVRVLAAPPRIVVEDDGPGMSADVLARVGEPFFSTREVGSGMGLGVFLARTLAERLGGGVHIDSAPGRGTRVTWTFAGGST